MSNNEINYSKFLSDAGEDTIFANSVRAQQYQFQPTKGEILDYGFRESIKGASVKEAISQKFPEFMQNGWNFAYDLHGLMYVKAALFQNSNSLKDYLGSHPTVRYIVVSPSLKRSFWGAGKVSFKANPDKFRNCFVISKLSADHFKDWLEDLKISYGVNTGTGPLKSRLLTAMKMVEQPRLPQPVNTGITKCASANLFEFEPDKNPALPEADFTSEDFQIGDIYSDSIDFF
jgi:hypothetical protein